MDVQLSAGDFQTPAPTGKVTESEREYAEQYWRQILQDLLESDQHKGIYVDWDVDPEFEFDPYYSAKVDSLTEKVLNYAKNDPGATAAEIAEGTGAKRSSVSSILSKQARKGHVARTKDEESRKYQYTGLPTMVEWHLGDTLQSCDTCIEMSQNGPMDIGFFIEQDIYPNSLELECRGYQCRCFLTVVDPPQQGRGPTTPTNEAEFEKRWAGLQSDLVWSAYDKWEAEASATRTKLEGMSED